MIPHSRPALGLEEITAVSDVILSGYIAQGKKVEEFEREFCGFVGLKRAVAVNSGTSGLHLALLALGVGEGDEVIVPDLVCTALLNAVHYVGAKAVLSDISDDDYNLSYSATKRLVTKKTKAIIIPHMFGMPCCDIEKFRDLGIPIIEDCAQAIGSKIRGRNVGTIGDISIYSFYATKVITTGEGGMVASNSDDLIDKVIDLREYDNKENYKVRYNYKMTDIQAAIGIEQLKKLSEYISKRKKIAKYYNQSFAALPMRLPLTSPNIEAIYFRYVIYTDSADNLINFLRNKGIGATKPVFRPLHHLIVSPEADYPTTENVWRNSVSLPIYPQLSEADVEEIVKLTRSFFV